MLDVSLLVLVQMAFEQTRSVQFDPDSLSNNLGRIHKVVQNIIMDSLVFPAEIVGKRIRIKL